MLTTKDGKKWANPAPTSGILTSVEAFAEQFVAVGEHGVILTSPGGNGKPEQWIYRVRAIGDQLVAVVGTILTSADGETWVQRHQ